ncbi:MAG: sterol desaturase family protein [Saprospiraceae bacterium]|nr:sterol desaturase family protein [Saprospiraceae bacterium]
MYFLIEKFGILNGWALGALFVFLRYTTFAGFAFMIFYVIWKPNFIKFKIQSKFPKTARIWHEIRHSAYTALIFASLGIGVHFLKQAGFTKIYTDMNEYGWGYLIFSFFLLTFIHDTYFYWIHRLMHHNKLFPILHKVHHVSNNPTPFASLSFHPLEAIVEIGIVPLAILFIPFHPLVLLLFATWSLFFNVMGHLGYELFPKGFVYHPIGRWFNTATHHNMHHARSNCNYGLYYNFWDTIMKTNAPDYQQTFEKIKTLHNY